MPFKTVFSGLLFVFMSPSLWSAPATYYVDSTRGDDHNAGTSANSPWRTVAKVSASKLSPGDVVLLRRGSV